MENVTDQRYRHIVLGNQLDAPTFIGTPEFPKLGAPRPFVPTPERPPGSGRASVLH
jgi:hypothetical protein